MERYGPSSYGDAFADVYDEWYAGGWTGDVADPDVVAATVAELAGGGAVLELGVGTGRLAIPLATRGVPVDGIDASAAMLERLRSKTTDTGSELLATAIGDMADVDVSALPHASYVVVLLAFNTLFNLTGADDQARCIANAASVLAPGGVLVIEAVVPADDGPASVVEARSIEVDRVVLSVSRRDRTSPRVDGQHIEITEAGIRLRPWMVRTASPEAIDAMAADAGLVLVERWSDWLRAPFTEADPVHVSLYGAG